MTIDDLKAENERLRAEKEQLQQAIGYIWAEACSLLDAGEDPRLEEFPAVWERAQAALSQKPEGGDESK